MANHNKIAMVAAILALGAVAIVTPALADGFPVIPQYSLPSQAPGFGTAPADHRAAIRDRTLYNSAVTPDAGRDYDSEWSTTGRQNAGH
jgi:hypothetical protein